MPTSSSPRSLGAQPGNLNALKHGFYTRRVRKRDFSDLQSSDFKGLAEEIAILRIFTRRLVERYEKTADLPETLLVVRTLCLASSCLNRMVRTQHWLNAQESPIQNALEQALKEIYVEWDLDDSASKSPKTSSPTDVS